LTMPDDAQPGAENGAEAKPPRQRRTRRRTEDTAQADGDSTAKAAVDSTADARADGAAEAEVKAEKAPRRQRTGRTSQRQRAGAATAAAEERATEDAPLKPRLLDTYRKEIVPALMREFGYDNPMRAPRINKIVLNIGVGDALTDGRAMDGATRDLTEISGQKPVITRARKSIAGFKVREGNPIGTAVTLRGNRMYHFLDRLINVALPRIRDFRGIPRRGFDGRGNFSIGIREQIIFPEIDYNQIDRIRGLQVTIATSAPDDAEAIRLLELYGMPFVRQA
jgi:large subunit ribosomal protein L5